MRFIVLTLVAQDSTVQANYDTSRAFMTPKLTPRERQVLVLVGEGLLNKQIAATLGVSQSHVVIDSVLLYSILLSLLCASAETNIVL